jgi:hypothetical protein
MKLVILAGASGSGKTSVADAIKVEPGLAEVLHFDLIQVPSSEAIVAGWGFGEAWRRAMKFAWMARIAAMSDQTHAVLFEGHVRLAFVRDAFGACHR